MAIIWRRGASVADLARVDELNREIAQATARRRQAIRERRAIVQRCYQRAIRANY